MKKAMKILSFIGLSFLLIGLTACGASDEGTDSDGEATGEEEFRIGLSMNTLNNPFFVDVKDGVEKAAEDNGIEVIVTDAQNEASKQVQDVENLVTQNLDAIIIDPTDSDAIIAGIEASNEAGIPVITMDREANGGEVVAHIGFDAIKSGGIAGDYIISQVKDLENAKIVEIQGIMGTNVAQDRSKGFNDAIGKASNIEKVATQAADFDRSTALDVMENILQANKEIDAVYAANDEMGLGVLEAVEAAGRLDEMVIISTDAIDPALDALKAGKLSATIAEPPFFLGMEALNTTLKHLRGEQVEKKVILDSTLVTEENVDDLETRK